MMNYDRMKKNNEKLKNLGIGYNIILPVLPNSSEIQDKIQNIDKTIIRFLCSYLAAMISFIRIAIQECPDETHFAEEDLKRAYDYVQKYKLFHYATKEEKNIFIDNSKEIGNPLKTEAAYVLGWILGIIPVLHFPDKACDIFLLDNFLDRMESVDDIKKVVKLRDIEDVLDELDFEYRCSSIIYENNSKSLFIPANIVNPDIVWERRVALEWYVGNYVLWDEEEIGN